MTRLLLLSRPLRRPSLGSCRPAPQWSPGGSQSRQVRPGSIHNVNLESIKEAARLAKPRAVTSDVLNYIPFSCGLFLDYS